MIPPQSDINQSSADTVLHYVKQEVEVVFKPEVFLWMYVELSLP